MNTPLHRVLLGTAVGDSLGLPYEGIAAAKVNAKLSGGLRHRLIFGRGMVSDDTEHTVFSLQALAVSGDDSERFQRELARRLKLWLMCIPAGIGFATLRSLLKLCVGFPPSRSGVFSAGNGPAMRSAVLGAWFREDTEALRQYVTASTKLTHSDPRAETAALAVAVTAAHDLALPEGQRPDAARCFALWESLDPDEAEWQGIIQNMRSAWKDSASLSQFAERLGLGKGVSGYAYHTVPMALYVWLRHHGDFETGLTEIIRCGGDTDTVGAIAGALLALRSNIPNAWIDGIADWPISVSMLKKTAELAAKNKPTRNCWPCLFFRNLGFLLIVLGHGLRRIVE